MPVIENSTAILEDGGPTTFNVTLPTGTAAGDALLAIIAKDDDPLMYSSGKSLLLLTFLVDI